MEHLYDDNGNVMGVILDDIIPMENISQSRKMQRALIGDQFIADASYSFDAHVAAC